MISLSVHIALMGFILVEAIQSALRAMAKLALAQGFGAVMLYGGVAACLFAVASWLVFGAGREGALRAGGL
ncbi:hypothetical protein [Janthinobacterium sp. RB2P8]|uniref:hypothetical protein n=1 Tax=Janthinobacterium sp. RB2P8 TaxID=3424191 RepID=UPI003F20DCB2